MRGQDAVPSGPSKTSLASAERPEAVSIALRDHRQPEKVNIEKVGQTYFFEFVPNCNLILPKTIRNLYSLLKS
jgi:hypothetical protein